MINSNIGPEAPYRLLSENMQEDVNYNIAHYKRKGENLDKLIKIYKECIDMFIKAFPKEFARIQDLQNLLKTIKHIDATTISTAV